MAMVAYSCNRVCIAFAFTRLWSLPVWLWTGLIIIGPTAGRASAPAATGAIGLAAVRRPTVQHSRGKIRVVCSLQ